MQSTHNSTSQSSTKDIMLYEDSYMKQFSFKDIGVDVFVPINDQLHKAHYRRFSSVIRKNLSSPSPHTPIYQTRLIEEKNSEKLVFQNESPSKLRKRLLELKHYAIQKLTQQNMSVPWKALKLEPIPDSTNNQFYSENRVPPKRNSHTSIKIRRQSLFPKRDNKSKWANGIQGFLEMEAKDPPMAKISPYYAHCPSCNIKNAEFQKISKGTFEKQYSEQFWKLKLHSIEKELVKDYGGFINYGK